MFGRTIKEDLLAAKADVIKPSVYKAEYIGGHAAFPKKHKTKVLVFPDHIELTELNLFIFMNQITDIANEDEKRIRKRRIVALGLVFLPLAIVGAVWKKKFTYPVIEYKERPDEHEQMVILDFGKEIERAQRQIYNRVQTVRNLMEQQKYKGIIEP